MTDGLINLVNDGLINKDGNISAINKGTFNVKNNTECLGVLAHTVCTCICVLCVCVYVCLCHAVWVYIMYECLDILVCV